MKEREREKEKRKEEKIYIKGLLVLAGERASEDERQATSSRTNYLNSQLSAPSRRRRKDSRERDSHLPPFLHFSDSVSLSLFSLFLSLTLSVTVSPLLFAFTRSLIRAQVRTKIFSPFFRLSFRAPLCSLLLNVYTPARVLEFHFLGSCCSASFWSEPSL